MLAEWRKNCSSSASLSSWNFILILVRFIKIPQNIEPQIPSWNFVKKSPTKNSYFCMCVNMKNNLIKKCLLDGIFTAFKRDPHHHLNFLLWNMQFFCLSKCWAFSQFCLFAPFLLSIWIWSPEHRLWKCDGKLDNEPGNFPSVWSKWYVLHYQRKSCLKECLKRVMKHEILTDNFDGVRNIARWLGESAM